MLLQKTEKGRTELKPGVRTLGLRERSLLLLADGNKSLADFKPMFDGEGEQIVRELVSKGYLEPVKAQPGGGFRADATGTFAVSTGVFQGAALKQAAAGPATAPAPLAPMAAPAPAAAAPAPAVAADSFEGKRSLATTRMFLFDICERMFARKAPELAEQFRESLRNAKDRESMLAAGRDMLAEIEKIAGPERADSISERIAMLLPPEAVS